MSEVALTILDIERSVHGNLLGSEADWTIAALAAEPESIEELDVAMRRFSGDEDQSHFGHFSPGTCDLPWDEGVVIIDLAARLIASESSYSAVATEGSVLAKPHDKWINYRLSDDWEVLLERRDFLSWDNQNREHQWSMTRRCPLGIERNTAAYRYAGFGTNEIVVYYDLMRFLMWECRERINQEGELNQTDEVRRLERLQCAWLNCPNPDVGGVPATIIDNERRQIPEGSTGSDSMHDPDCPCCQMMAEEDFGPMFWHLDGSGMEDEFAFSFYKTRQEWDDEQKTYEEFNREFERKRVQQQLEKEDLSRVWKRTFVAEHPSDEMPLSQFVPVAMFGFAAMVGELNEDIGELAYDESTIAAQRETLNRLVGNIHNSLNESAELIAPTLDRMIDELAELADEYPELAEKCADFARRLQEFPSQLAESAGRGDTPF